MPDQDSSSNGLTASLRRLVDTGLKLVQNRLELFSLELKEEKQRAVELLVLASTGIFFGILAVLIITLTIVYALKEHALLVLLLFSVAYAGASAALLRCVRSRLKDRPPPFSSSVGELRKDRQWLHPKD